MAWYDRLRRSRPPATAPDIVESTVRPPIGSYAALMPAAREAWFSLNKQAAESEGGMTTEMQLVKGVLERPAKASAPVVGIPDIGFKGARQQLFQRYHLIDLYAIAYNNNVLQTARGNLKQEVFRRGFNWEEAFAHRDRRTGREYTEAEYQELREAKVSPLTGQLAPGSLNFLEVPNITQRQRFEEFIKNVNIYGQSLLTLLHALEDDLNIADDAFLFMSAEYRFGWTEQGPEVRRSVKQLYRLDPVFMEFDTDEENRPGFAHHLCLRHRDNLLTIPRDEDWHLHWRGVCPLDGLMTFPVIYRYTPYKGTFGVTTGVAAPDARAMYLVKGEVIHVSKFSPSELYGYSPILSIYEKALSLIGMDRYLYDYFFERYIPQGVVTTVTDNPDDLEARRDQILAETLNNPHYIPWLAVSSKTGQGRTEFVRFAYSLDELQFLPVQEHIEKSVAALYGVPDLFMGDTEGSGGLNNETQQLTRMSRGARLSQAVHDVMLEELLLACGVTDWTLSLESSEETTEEFEWEMKQKKATHAQTMVGMGFGAKYNQETDEFDFTGEVKSQDEQQQAFSGGMGGM